MKRSRNILALSALLAVAAWTNVQLMTCCWFTGDAGKSTHAASATGHEQASVDGPADMAEDHSCCPGQNSASSEPSQTDSKPSGHTASHSPAQASSHAASHTSSHNCGAQMSGSAAICCAPETSPGELTASNVSLAPYSLTHLVLATWALFPAGEDLAMRTHTGGSDISDASGSPRFLSLQRILI